MGSLNKDKDEFEDESPDEEEQTLSGEDWAFGAGEGTWQSRSRTVKDRVAALHNNREMADICILACDENWWFGETVKDFSASLNCIL